MVLNDDDRGTILGREWSFNLSAGTVPLWFLADAEHGKWPVGGCTRVRDGTGDRVGTHCQASDGTRTRQVRSEV